MPLDNAEFISELSITDPPGTDPVNQGDDHIRTTKRAVQQSFPNVGAAVPQTAAQMAQMAIKNEANVFTLTNTFQASQTFQNGMIVSGSPIKGFDGSQALPGYTFGNEQTMGMYRDTAGRLSFGVGNVLLGFFSSAGFNSQGLLTANAGVASGLDGSVAAPAYRFTSSTNTGMFRNASGQLAFAHNGVQVASMASTNFDTILKVRAQGGTAALPAFTFTGDAAKGMYSIDADRLGFAVAGLQCLRFESNREAHFANQVLAVDGIETFPGFAFTTFPGSGMFVQTGGVIAFATDGAFAMSMRGSGNAGIFAGVGVAFQADGNLSAATFPGYTFSNDTDSGFYRAAANSVSVAAGGGTAINFDFPTLAMWAGAGYAIRGDPSRVATQPAFAFTNDTDTGFFLVQANVAGIAAAGGLVCSFGLSGFGVAAGVPSFLSLPTSPGVGGSLWNNGGVVNVA